MGLLACDPGLGQTTSIALATRTNTWANGEMLTASLELQAGQKVIH